MLFNTGRLCWENKISPYAYTNSLILFFDEKDTRLEVKSGPMNEIHMLSLKTDRVDSMAGMGT